MINNGNYCEQKQLSRTNGTKEEGMCREGDVHTLMMIYNDCAIDIWRQTLNLPWRTSLSQMATYVYPTNDDREAPVITRAQP